MQKDKTQLTNVTEYEKQGTSCPNSPQIEGQVLPVPPYHVFTRNRKLQMVWIVSLAAIFSPLSSNIYFPALGEVSKVSEKDPRNQSSAELSCL